MSDSELEKRYPDGKWDGEADYLAGSRILLHNDDYLEFLVTKVWKLEQPCRVVDFGCGSGRFGQMLMPLLPKGSTYTGIDQSPQLIANAQEIFNGAPFESKLITGDVHEVPFADDSFDVAVSHAVLMHIPNPVEAVQEMIRVTRDGGMVITCDANRIAHSALFHIDEINTQETTPLGLFQTISNGIRKRTGVDHNIGIKTPVMMHKAGLMNIQARVSDCVRILFPPVDTDHKETIFQAICNEGYGTAEPSEEERANWKANLVKYGVSEEDAESEIERALSWDFREKGRDYHTVYPGLLTFSFGTVEKSNR